MSVIKSSEQLTGIILACGDNAGTGCQQRERLSLSRILQAIGPSGGGWSRSGPSGSGGNGACAGRCPC